MLYEPFLPCGFGVKSVVTGAVGAVGLVLLAAGTIKARGRLIPLAWFSWLTIGLAVLMLIWKRYDYGAYKLLSAGYPFLAVLVANGAAARAWWSRGAGGLIAAVYTVLIGLRLVSLDGTAKFKTVEEFRGMLAYIPPSSIVVMKIKDNLAFEWAAYYLRDRRTVPLVGRLPYLPPKPLNDPTLQRLLPQAQFWRPICRTTCAGARRFGAATPIEYFPSRSREQISTAAHSRRTRDRVSVSPS